VRGGVGAALFAVGSDIGGAALPVYPWSPVAGGGASVVQGWSGGLSLACVFGGGGGAAAGAVALEGGAVGCAVPGDGVGFTTLTLLEGGPGGAVVGVYEFAYAAAAAVSAAQPAGLWASGGAPVTVVGAGFDASTANCFGNHRGVRE
jgi:hypothetical protein